VRTRLSQTASTKRRRNGPLRSPLRSEDLDSYLTLAASLINVSMGAQVSDEVIALVNGLLGESEAARNVASDSLSERSEDEQLAALDVLFATAKRMEDAGAVVRGAVLWVGKTPALEQAAAAGVGAHCWGGTPDLGCGRRSCSHRATCPRSMLIGPSRGWGSAR